MSFAVRILPIEEVCDHPNADRLTINRVLGYECITAKLDDGSHRYAPGDKAIYVPEGAVLTEQQLRDHGFWRFNEQQGREMGMLAGRDGNRVKPAQLRKRMSTGLLWPVPADMDHLPLLSDVTEALGITKFVPEVPEALLNCAMPLFEARSGFDIARLRMYPDFLAEDIVTVTEKIEGECIVLTWLGGDRHDGLFHDGQIAIATKGLSEQGLVFIDNEAADRVPVVQAVKNSGLLAKFASLALSVGPNAKIQLFAEAAGPGVKKLHYGFAAPLARVFDIKVNGSFVANDAKASLFEAAHIERVPVLYTGPFDRALFESLREGPTTISGSHVREGIVVTADGHQDKRMTPLGDEMRPILKLHSDVFLKKFGITDDDA